MNTLALGVCLVVPLAGIFTSLKLSVLTMCSLGLAFLAMLIAPIFVPAAARALLLGAAMEPYHLYFSQLYCKAHVGAHVTVLVPPALILTQPRSQRARHAVLRREGRWL